MAQSRIKFQWRGLYTRQSLDKRVQQTRWKIFLLSVHFSQQCATVLANLIESDVSLPLHMVISLITPASRSGKRTLKPDYLACFGGCLLHNVILYLIYKMALNLFLKISKVTIKTHFCHVITVFTTQKYLFS